MNKSSSLLTGSHVVSYKKKAFMLMRFPYIAEYGQSKLHAQLCTGSLTANKAAC